VTTKGIEATLAAKLNEQLTLNLNGSYIKARYGDFPGVSCYVDLSNSATGTTVNQPDCTTAANATPTLAAGTINARGHQLAGSPDYQYKAALNYVRPDTLGGWTAYADANWYWQSSVQYQASGDPKSLQPAFGMLGGSVGLGSPDDKWRLSLYATNLLDKHWAANISPAPTAALNPGGEIQYLSPDSFRHVGVRLDAKF
jgi:iron complex outermembrane receptor protein